MLKTRYFKGKRFIPVVTPSGASLPSIKICPEGKKYNPPVVPATDALPKIKIYQTIKGGSGGAIAEYTPLTEGNCLIGIDADLSTKTYSSGTSISQINDLSGNSRNATSSGTNQPTYVSSVLNGKGVIRFDGSNDFLTFGNILNSELTLTTTELTLFAVYKNTGTGNQVILGKHGDGTHSENNRQLIMYTRTLKQSIYIAPTTDGANIRIQDGNNNISTSGFNIGTFIVNMSQKILEDKQFTMLTNIRETMTTAVSAGVEPAQISSGVAQLSMGAIIGAAGTIATTPLNGDIAALYLFGEQLSRSARTRVFNYLKTRFGL